MGRRADLQTLLEETLGSEYVYYQPPETVKLCYPCIIYELGGADTDFADNKPYTYKKRYAVTLIDRNLDSEIPDKIAAFPLCVLNRPYTADNLNHWLFTLYF